LLKIFLFCSIKEKDGEYHYILFDRESCRLYISFIKDNKSYSYNIILDANEVVYYVFDENEQLDKEVFEFGLEKEAVTDREKELSNLLKKLDK